VTEGYVALGGNLGDVRAHFVAALAGLRQAGYMVVRVSSLYRSAPWGPPDQPDYLNAVVQLRGADDPHTLLQVTQALERAAGRTDGVRNGPRPLDLDIIRWGDTRLATPALTLPHPRWQERDFVMVPLAELLPDAAARAAQCTVRQLTGMVAGPEWATGEN
jgi:2-amino-4-hydroxy-6-hydroxymethyldihydropteridine diphosphokinase